MPPVIASSTPPGPEGLRSARARPPLLRHPISSGAPRREGAWRAPEALHPALWLGHQLGTPADAARSSGFAGLDAHLPGGGWPCRSLTELLLPHPGVGEVRLLAPSLVPIQQAGRLVMLFDPPAVLSGWALGEMGLDVEQLLVIQTQAGGEPAGHRSASGRLWALEQVLKSGHVGAVLAWLPHLPAEKLRRLQLAAHAHDGPAFMLRDLGVQQHPSPSPLRLALKPAGVDRLDVHILKRRGPPLALPVPLSLPAALPGGIASPWAVPTAAGEEPAPRPPRPLAMATFVNLA